jgi:hypothetical protein
VLPCALRIHATHGKKGSRNAPYPYATSLYQPREVETTIVVGKALFYKYYILFHATSQNITDKKTCNAGARPPPFFAYPPPYSLRFSTTPRAFHFSSGICYFWHRKSRNITVLFHVIAGPFVARLWTEKSKYYNTIPGQTYLQLLWSKNRVESWDI